MENERCRNRRSKQYTGDVSVRQSDTMCTHRRRNSITAIALAAADCTGPCSRPMHTLIGTTSGSQARKTFRRTAVRRPGGTSAAPADATCSQSTRRSRGSCGTCQRLSKESPCPATRGQARSTYLSLRNHPWIEFRTLCPSTTAMRHQKSAQLQPGIRIGKRDGTCVQCRRTERFVVELEAHIEQPRTAWSQRPERFVHGVPKLQPLPKEVWINPPKAATTPQSAQ